MPKRRGGQNSEKARKGTAEPDAERSDSEDEPMAEPPMPTPYVRQWDTETQTDPEPLTTRHFKEAAKIIGDMAHEITSNNYTDAETQTSGKADSVGAAVQSIPGYTPRNEKDRVMLSRAAMHKHQIVLQCAQCKAGTLTDVIVVVALCAPMACQSSGYTLMRPAGQSGKATAAAFKDK